MFAKGSYPWQLGADQVFTILLIAFTLMKPAQKWSLDGRAKKTSV
jgi:hypothetical protein